MRLAAALRPDRPLLVMLLLGFSAGLPLPLTGFTLRQWFSEANVPLGAIGLTALIGLAYSLKFLWAPVLDHAPPLLPSLGRRRGWLAPVQLLLAAAIAALALTDPARNATGTVAAAVAVAFLSATQDITIDAFRIESLPLGRQGLGLAAYVWGYRIALLVANAGVLFSVERVGWRGAFLAMALLMSVGLATTLFLAREPRPPERAARSGIGAWLAAAVVAPVRDFLCRPGAWLILGFVALFKLGEALAGIMTAPFYRALGFAREEVAAVSGVFGLLATLAGVTLGGVLVAGVGTGRALVVTGLGQMLSNLMYVALAEAGRSLPLLWAQVGIENATDGLADAAFVAYLSGLTSTAFTATQYALLSSLASLPLRTVGGLSGYLAEAMGWTRFFLLTTAAALPGLAIMLVLLRRFPPAQA
ncbi:MFS transporter [Elioraea tepida]|jgi:PAT family beta-lactamase induction signal transducer AmpG|uniref:MFS transporter n=1 Tax=Elioraea tepida TaxID=2843330 RepID=A0A975U5S2_9PROT|nr:MFS transporter [Elioraea tepida]QXM25953.1 MFS transporter [Elioraea tepida]